MTSYRSACTSTSSVLIRGGIRYEGNMTHIDQMSQDTVQCWADYNPNDIKPSDLVATDVVPLYQLVNTGNNVKSDKAYQYIFNCTGLITQDTTEDLHVSPNDTIATGTTNSPLSLYNMSPVAIDGNPNTLENFKKLFREILFSMGLLTSENENHKGTMKKADPNFNNLAWVSGLDLNKFKNLLAA